MSFKEELLAETTVGVVDDRNNGFGKGSPKYSISDFGDSGNFLVTSTATLLKLLLKLFAI